MSDRVQLRGPKLAESLKISSFDAGLKTLLPFQSFPSVRDIVHRDPRIVALLW